MVINIQPEAIANADRFYTMVKSLNIFDNVEVSGVIDTLLSPSQEDICFIGTYYRARGYIGSILEFQNPRHFQAIAMLARSLFELAVDIRLLEVIPNSTIKMNAFIEVEKLRSARKAVAFKSANPQADVDTSTHAAYISNNENRVDSIRQSLWPNLDHVNHWSGRRMRSRVQLLKSPFEQLYEVEYPRLSWYVHPGLTGVTNLKPETFTYLCSHGFYFAVNAYWEVLMTVIRKFKIEKANEKIKLKLKVAQMLPFADDPEHVNLLKSLIQ